ncbi:MAG: ABC transporter substrate-binding protein, partial [Bradyrhizobium sp.]
MKFKSLAGLAAAMSLALAGHAQAASKVINIGAIFPMSGGAASAGIHAKYALEVAEDIINNAHPELGALPLAKTAGLPNLGGAKVHLIFADSQGSPAAGQNQALRLITQDKVVALTGAYQSGVTLTASAIAEKYGIPFVNGESTASNLTERGFKWFFRTTPIASDFVKVYIGFLKHMKKAGAKIGSIAVVHDTTEYGTSVSGSIIKAFKAQGLNVSLDVAYTANATDLESQVLQLK